MLFKLTMCSWATFTCNSSWNVMYNAYHIWKNVFIDLAVCMFNTNLSVFKSPPPASISSTSCTHNSCTSLSCCHGNCTRHCVRQTERWCGTRSLWCTKWTLRSNVHQCTLNLYRTAVCVCSHLSKVLSLRVLSWVNSEDARCPIPLNCNCT